MPGENCPRITQDYLRQNNVVVKDQATHTPDMHPIDQELHILGQPGRVWCGILSKGTLQAVAVMLLGQRRLSQLQIGHIVGQIKDSGLVVVHCSVILSSRNWCWCRKSRLTCLNILFCALVSCHKNCHQSL